MLIPTNFLPMRTRKITATKRGEVTLEKSESNLDSSERASEAEVIVHDQREGEDRRKRKEKPLLDTRSGRDRRHDSERPSIDIKA
jgi:hypothetical protein